ncbi:MAG: T9SS type A sorting domain-containing protein, partial [Candidatus Zixiibacteriota bacterium]
VPNDTSIFLCAPIELSFPICASDIDGNFNRCELVSGPGSLTNGNWVHTPSMDKTDTVVVKCLDSCGAFCEDQFVITYSFNNAPVAYAGKDTTYFVCNADTTICWYAFGNDVDGNLASCGVISALGTYDALNNKICLHVTQEKTYSVTLQSVDECGVTVQDIVLITINANQSPTIDLPYDFTAYTYPGQEVCFTAGIWDADNNLGNVAVSNGEYISGDGTICFIPDTTGDYWIHVTAYDQCGDSATDSIKVNVEIDECFGVQIEKAHNVYQGHHEYLDVIFHGSAKPVAGFDLLIAYDNSALVAAGVESGQLFDNCDWEYFTYRFGPFGNCDNGCPSGLLRIVGMADMNNGAYHPGCYFNGFSGDIATIDFLVSSNYTLGCQFVPVNFFWIDCGDNSFSSENGDTLWVSRLVSSWDGNDITDYTYGFPGYYGVHNDCMIPDGPDKPTAERCIDFTNGGIDIICPDSIDGRGDINLNGVPNEIADAVVYTGYFIYGLNAFTVNVEGQIAASDINGDGIALTVADLVYMIRIIVGDALPIPKLSPMIEAAAEFSIAGECITLENTDAPIGAIHITYEGDIIPTLTENASHMNVEYHYDGLVTRAIIYSMNKDSYLESGPIVNSIGGNNVISIDVASYDGNTMKSQLNVLPDNFELGQNYPNPFNPTTVINFALPQVSDVNIEVYNILGRKVVTLIDERMDAGYHSVNWNGTNSQGVSVASGVYFYRLTAGEFTQSKKMVLLK